MNNSFFENPLVTVYVLNYNYSKYIYEAISSVLNQTYENIEIILIDDGSTDNSVDIINEFINKYPRIKVIQQKNKGLVKSINTAIRIAKGEYVIRLDADDYFAPEAIEKLVKKITYHKNCALVFSDFYLINEDGTFKQRYERLDFDKEVKILDSPAHGACTLFRLKVLKEFGGYSEEYDMQDGYYIWLKIIKKYKVTNLNEPLFYYRQHHTSLSKNTKKLLETRMRIKHDVIAEMNPTKMSILAVIPISSYTFNNKLALLNLGEYSVIQNKIQELCKSENIDKIIVLTSEKAVTKHVLHNFKDNSKITVFSRKQIDEAPNVSLVDSYLKILESLKESLNYIPNAVLTVNLEFPFIKIHQIQDLINSLVLFNSDSGVMVSEERDSIYKYSGSGLLAINDDMSKRKLERESLFKANGGILISKSSAILKNKKLISGLVTHSLIDEYSNFQIKNDFDYQIAKFISKNLIRRDGTK
jgi:CMP-N-acetylneuraminic acid synthetase